MGKKEKRDEEGPEEEEEQKWEGSSSLCEVKLVVNEVPPAFTARKLIMLSLYRWKLLSGRRILTGVPSGREASMTTCPPV